MDINGEEGKIMDNRKELMADEQLMTRVLNSMKLHQKAKVIIY